VKLFNPSHVFFHMTMSDLQLKQTLKAAYPSRNIDVRAALFAKMQSGSLSIAPRRSLVFLRRLLIATHAALLLLNAAAIISLVRSLSSQETWAYLRESFTALSEYRDLAWLAFWESIPATSVLLVIATLAGLAFSLVLHRRLKQQSLLTN
jgi:hypothetical protein